MMTPLFESFAVYLFWQIFSIGIYISSSLFWPFL